jgi:hypothetical protein
MAIYRSSPPSEPEKCLQPVVTVAIRADDREASIIEGSALLDDNISESLLGVPFEGELGILLAERRKLVA